MKKLETLSTTRTFIKGTEFEVQIFSITFLVLFLLISGVYIIDRYTYYALEFLEGVDRGSKKTMGQFLEVCPQRLCMSTVGNRTDLFARDPYNVPITDFFGSVRSVQLTQSILELPEVTTTIHSSASGDQSCDSQSCETVEKTKVAYTYVNPLPILDEIDT